MRHINFVVKHLAGNYITKMNGNNKRKFNKKLHKQKTLL